MGWSPFSALVFTHLDPLNSPVGSQQPLGAVSGSHGPAPPVLQLRVYSTGLPWPAELVEEVITIIKQHEKVLDILISTCSLLLRVLGQGGQAEWRSSSLPAIPSLSVLFLFELK